MQKRTKCRHTKPPLTLCDTIAWSPLLQVLMRYLPQSQKPDARCAFARRGSSLRTRDAPGVRTAEDVDPDDRRVVQEPHLAGSGVRILVDQVRRSVPVEVRQSGDSPAIAQGDVGSADQHVAPTSPEIPDLRL